MRLEQLNFRHLLYFWRVARIGHLTRAAQELHTSQSSLSAQIRQFEQRLGDDLFMREGRRLILTETGHLVLAYAENIFGLGQEMLGRLQGQGEGMLHLRIGSVATMSRNYQENLFRPLLGDGSVVLTLESGQLGHLLERLAEHQLDLVLANEPVATDPQRPLHSRLLGGQPLSLIGPAQHWQGRTLRVPDDLQGLDIALPGPRHAVRSQFDALCKAAEIEPQVRAEVDDMAMLRLIARDSGWLALMPEVVVQDELRNGLLCIVGECAQLQEQFYAITTPRRHRIERLESLLQSAHSKGLAL
jgi:LysR family transcriptional activator of nhaA